MTPLNFLLEGGLKPLLIFSSTELELLTMIAWLATYTVGALEKRGLPHATGRQLL